MRHSILSLLFLAGVSLAGAPFAQAQTDGSTYHRCAQPSLIISESAGVLRIPIERVGNVSVPSTASLLIYASETWYWLGFPVGTFSIPFAAGETLRTFDYPIQNDHYDGTVSTTAICGGSAPRDRSTMSISITDDEPVPTLTVPPLVEVTETDGLMSIQIPVSIDVAFGRWGHVDIQRNDITTSPVDDYAVGRSFSFGEGEKSESIQMFITGDLQAEDDEELILTLTGVMAPRTIRVRIVDDDRPPYTLALDQSVYSFAEGTPAFVTITRSGETSSRASATLHFSSVRTVPLPSDVPIEFAPGETSKTIEVPISDGWYTGDRFGAMEIIVVGYVADRAEMGVTEDDPRPVLSIIGGEAIEGNAGQTTKLDVTVTLSAPLGLDLNANVATANGTAGADDYSRLATSLFFTPGELSRKVSIDVRGDVTPEADETFTVSVVSCCPQLATVGNGTATAIIRDDDRPGVRTEHRFENTASIEAHESAKWLAATIVRSGNTTIASTTSARLTADTARQFAPIEVQFRANEKRKNVRFYIDDSYYSGDATGRLEILTASVPEDQRNVTILDDESRPAVSIADIEVIEGPADHTVALTISVMPPSFRAIDLAMQSIAGSALGDFRNLPGFVRIPPLASTFAVPVTIVGDSAPEPLETFNVTISPMQDSAAVRGDAEAVCTIHDDDRGARLTFASDRIERGTAVTMMLELSAPAAAAGVVQLSASTPEIVGVPSTIEVPAGVSSVPVSVSGLRVGDTLLHIELPASLGSAVLDTPLSVYCLASPVATPQNVRVPRGGTATVQLSLLPLPDDEIQIALTSLDRTIAGTDASALVGPGTTSTFIVYGAAIGSTTLSITLPAAYGGTTLVLPVEVVEPSNKRRASKH